MGSRRDIRWMCSLVLWNGEELKTISLSSEERSEPVGIKVAESHLTLRSSGLKALLPRRSSWRCAIKLRRPEEVTGGHSILREKRSITISIHLTDIHCRTI